jgi:citrate lyase subunit beta/citryl-CoA lyase
MGPRATGLLIDSISMPLPQMPRIRSLPSLPTDHARRSCLIMPGSQPRFHAKADHSKADQVIFDLEDSVAPAVKGQARDTVVSALQTYEFAGKLRAVRVNACDTAWCYEDIISIVEGAGDRIDSLVIPKVEGVNHVHFADNLLSQIERKVRLQRPISLELQIESAAGLLNIGAIAAASVRNQALILGPADLAASLRVPELTIGDLPTSGSGYQDYVSVQILVASRAFGLRAIDGPYARIHDAGGLRVSAERAASLGFDGKWAVHPGQVDVLNGAFAPRQEDLDRAAAILEAYGQATRSGREGAVMLGDEMIDEASWKLAVVMTERGQSAGMKARRSTLPLSRRRR